MGPELLAEGLTTHSGGCQFRRCRPDCNQYAEHASHTAPEPTPVHSTSCGLVLQEDWGRRNSSMDRANKQSLVRDDGLDSDTPYGGADSREETGFRSTGIESRRLYI